ncbi:MAG: dephospho-CoA kinase [Bacteroidales bacterium]|nr:dephospho-CoA kinase [Bacteroidales bacterium]
MEGGKTIIAVTGGIGSGKSCIVKAFETLGVPSYDCDSRAKALYREDSLLVADIVKLFGEEVLSGGHLNLKAMSERVFGDRAQLLALEALVHPAVMRDYLKWQAAVESPMVVVESAIFFEKPFFDNFAHFSITVSLPENIRIARVMERDGLTAGQVRSRLANQWSDEQREARADMVLRTDDRTAIMPVIIKLIDELKS